MAQPVAGQNCSQVPNALKLQVDPWQVEITEGSQFVIRDANECALVYVCARSDSALHDKYLTPAEAMLIAEASAKLSAVADCIKVI